MREAFDLAVRSLEQPDVARRVITIKVEVQQLVSEAEASIEDPVLEDELAS